MAKNKQQEPKMTLVTGLINTLLLSAVITAAAAVYWALTF